MAGDGWVMDIIFHSLILVANELQNLWSAWSTEILLVLSFVMQFLLTILAGFRWRRISNKVWDEVLKYVIWLCYVGGDYVTTMALGNLSVSNTAGERQLLAFWAPFFLLHLGGPDNISAFQLADNELSARSVLELILRASGAVYVVYKSVSGSWTLAAAAWLMLVVGVAKYMEKILALHRANLGNIRNSINSQGRDLCKGGQRVHKKAVLPEDTGKDNIALLMVAHSLFHICKRAMVQSSFDIESDDAQESKRTLFKLPWEEMCQVMEIQLSLMYDFLYTKAAVIHTWHGYSIRVYSPLATAAALLLVEFGHHDGSRRRVDMVITRVLLAATFMLETASLLRTLGSSWTAFLLYSTGRWGWLHHQVLCTSRWRRFRAAVASIRWLAKMEGHRRWSGRIGQLNLLQLSTNVRGDLERIIKSSDDESTEFTSQVKELVFRQLPEKLNELMTDIERRETEGVEVPDLLRIAAESRMERGQQALRKAFGKNTVLYEDFRRSLGLELQVGILTWHIATDVYLCKSVIGSRIRPEDKESLEKRMTAIKVLSNYMMFLLMKRPHMLPGLVFHRLYELTYEELVQIWSQYGAQHHPNSPMLSPENFARVLSELESDAVKSYNLSSGIDLAKKLLSEEEKRTSYTLSQWIDKVGSESSYRLRVWSILDLILDVWVEMLFYASYRCSRESHARQLGSGGELTTIIWLFAEHAGLFASNRKKARLLRKV